MDKQRPCFFLWVQAYHGIASPGAAHLYGLSRSLDRVYENRLEPQALPTHLDQGELSR